MTQDTARRPYAVVTAATSGTGLELAHRFSLHGYDVLLVAEDDAVLDAPARLGGCGCAEARQVDMADYDAVEGLWAQVAAAGRPVDAIAIAIAGGGGHGHGRFVEADLLDDLDLIDRQLAATVHLAKRALQAMVAQGHGRVLFAEVGGRATDVCPATAAAATSFLRTFLAAVSAEVGPRGVTVMAVRTTPADDPADVACAGVDALLADDSAAAGSRHATEARRVVV